MTSPETYLALNPFVDLSVGEAELWGTRAWLDVPQIHAAQTAQLKSAVQMVRAAGRTQVRFVRGAGGSGKSHLFARLRRELGDAIFYAYAPNPPLQPEMLEAFLLHKVVSSLRQRAREPGGADAAYSQLRLLAYALLQPVIGQGDLPVPQLHEAWRAISADDQDSLIQTTIHRLETQHPEVSRSVLRCLLGVLKDDRENLAGQWLGGSAHLTETDLRALGESEPLGPEQHGPLLHLLGRLAGQAGRALVLILDQLDLITTPAQLDEFQRVLFSLIDQSEHWCVFIGLVGERFRFWDENLNQALRGRLAVPSLQHPGTMVLPVIEVSPIASADKEALLLRRLSAPLLERQRGEDALESNPLHPMTAADVQWLAGGGAVFARHLLAACSERYAQALLAGSNAGRVPLADKLDALLEEAADHARADAAHLNALDLGERLRELVELLAEPPLHCRNGSLRDQVKGFIGTDHLIESGGQRARLISTDATRRPLIAVLEQLQHDASGSTLLVRSAASSLSGQVTMELFRQFKDRNHFHQVSSAEAATLMGLGSVLAALREGTYEQLLTEPPPTAANVMAALRDNGRLRSLRLWHSVRAALAGRPSPAPIKPATSRVPLPMAGNGSGFSVAEPSPFAVATAPAMVRRSTAPISLPRTRTGPVMPVEKLSQQAIETIHVLLRLERWMEMRRLQRRLEDLGCPCSLESLRHTLRQPPLSQHALLHPAQVHDDGSGPQIVLWHEPVP